MHQPQITNSAGLSESITIVGAGLTAASKELVTQALPDCHILESKLDSWRTVRFCKLVGPAILIIDYEALARIETEQIPAVEFLSTVQVLVLSRICDESTYNGALLAGCSGVLEATSSQDTLRKAVKAIEKGDLWYPRAVLSALARRSILSRGISQKNLTEREEEILRLLGMDRKNQEIADQLFISRETVRWHLRTLYSKIGVTNRPEARHYALKHRDNITKATDQEK